MGMREGVKSLDDHVTGVVDGVLEAGEGLVLGVRAEAQPGSAAVRAERRQSSGDDDRDHGDRDAETERCRARHVVVVQVDRHLLPLSLVILVIRVLRRRTRILCNYTTGSFFKT